MNIFELVKNGLATCENFEYADLHRANLSGANLSYTNLQGANLSGANLRNLNLKGVLAPHANFECADLRNSNLDRTNFDYANFTNASLVACNLRYASFIGANLRSIKTAYCGFAHFYGALNSPLVLDLQVPVNVDGFGNLTLEEITLPVSDWENQSEKQLAQMGIRIEEFWAQYKVFILNMARAYKHN